MGLIILKIAICGILTIVGVNGNNILLEKCSLSCGVNENQPNYALRGGVVDSHRGIEPMGPNGEPGSPGYEQLLPRIERLEEILQLLVTGWYRAGSNPNLFYKLYDTPADYSVAKKKCEVENARLASTGIRNETIRREIDEILDLNSGWMWIGLDDLDHPSGWMWSDGVLSTNENTDWDDNQPDYDNEHCAHIWGNTKINNRVCSDELSHYLCEKEI